MVSIDFFTVPTITMRVLFVFLVLEHGRRQVLHFNVTEHPTAAWTAQQIVAAFPIGMRHDISSEIGTSRFAEDDYRDGRAQYTFVQCPAGEDSVLDAAGEWIGDSLSAPGLTRPGPAATSLE